MNLKQPRAEGVWLAWGAGLFISAYSLGVLVWLLNPAWMAWSAFVLSPTLRWCGVPCMALGAAVHLWGSHHLGRNLTITIGTRRDHTLITSGPYRWVRHPLYSGGMIESLGVALLVENGFVAIAAAAFWIVVVIRTAREEAILVETFGEAYRNYQGCTGPFIPR